MKVFVELFIQSDGHAKMKVFSTLVTQRSKGCQPDAKTHARKKRGQHVQMGTESQLLTTYPRVYVICETLTE